MADTPEITVAVMADIAGLQKGMRDGERIVSGAAGNMASAIDRADIGNRFNKQAMHAIRGLSAITSAINTVSQAQGDLAKLADGFSQSMMMSGSKIAGIFGAAYQAGAALNELFTGSEAAKAAQAQELAAMKLEDKYRDETRDLERQLEILKEMDPIRKIELDGQRELARIRARARNEDESDAARKRTAAEELLAIERTRLRIEEERRKSQARPATGLGLVGSITTSLGGTFNFAQNAVLQGLQRVAIQQAGYQANLVVTAREILQILRNNGTVIT